MSVQTPRELGYRMPAEWHPHAATWLSWPRPGGISFPERYAEVLPTLAEMVRAIAAHERVEINVRDDEVEEIARKTIGDLSNARFHRIPSYEPWCRDHGPIFVVRKSKTQSPKPSRRQDLRSKSKIAVVDWGYNAWGGKYPPFDDDDAVPQRIAEALGLPVFSPGIILEGGSIDVNGEGTLLTTESCLLNPNRNPGLTKSQIEQYLKDYLGVTNILWLGEGIVGDDTDGHIDDIARFVDPTTVVAVVEQDAQDENFQILQTNLKRLRAMKTERGEPLCVIELPMCGVVKHEGQRLPASYGNFYIANGIVLLPTYRHKANDQRAQEILQQCFPDRRVVPMDSTNLIWGLGSFHCLTQQQPAV
jgi:agmatine deiminase